MRRLRDVSCGGGGPRGGGARAAVVPPASVPSRRQWQAPHDLRRVRLMRRVMLHGRLMEGRRWWRALRVCRGQPHHIRRLPRCHALSCRKCLFLLQYQKIRELVCDAGFMPSLAARGAMRIPGALQRSDRLPQVHHLSPAQCQQSRQLASKHACAHARSRMHGGKAAGWRGLQAEHLRVLCTSSTDCQLPDRYLRLARQGADSYQHLPALAR